MSTTFKDSEGREWLLRLSVNSLRDVRDNVGIDLGKLLEDRELLPRLYQDVCLLVDVLYELCKGQAKTRNLDPRGFAEGLCGDAIEAATLAFTDAFIEFLPPAKRRLLRQLVDASRAGQAQAELRITNAINNGLLTNAIHREMEKLDATLEKLAKESPTGTPTT